MALLTTQQRAELLAEIMRALSQVREPCAVKKPDIVAAIAATDQWQEDNAASYNTALPVAARTSLTAAQKARLFNLVANKRWGG